MRFVAARSSHVNLAGSLPASGFNPFVLDCAFCDDGICYYDAGFIHASHSPNHMIGKEQWIRGDHVVLHFAFVNWEETLIKYAWYKCLERIRLPKKTISEINTDYDSGTNENGIKLTRIPDSWFASYAFFDASIFEQFPLWRAQQVAAWLKQYGKEHFAGLKLDAVDWSKYDH